MRETEKYYFFYKHQFGQWTKRDMVDPDGRIYICCEQYMMYKKAMLFSDVERAKAIMQETDPSHQQQLGRKVSGYEQEVWDKHRVGVVWYANYLKFSQHEDLKSRLLATGNKVLAEASPDDLVWGIGLSAQDDRILNVENWRGHNLLGKVLMSVRSTLLLS